MAVHFNLLSIPEPLQKKIISKFPLSNRRSEVLSLYLSCRWGRHMAVLLLGDEVDTLFKGLNSYYMKRGDAEGKFIQNEDDKWSGCPTAEYLRVLKRIEDERRLIQGNSTSAQRHRARISIANLSMGLQIWTFFFAGRPNQPCFICDIEEKGRQCFSTRFSRLGYPRETSWQAMLSEEKNYRALTAPEPDLPGPKATPPHNMTTFPILTEPRTPIRRRTAPSNVTDSPRLMSFPRIRESKNWFTSCCCIL